MVRLANESELSRVNELRNQVSQVHAEGRPDIFRSDFCEELKQHLYEQWEREDADIIVAIREHVICGFAVVEYIDKPLSIYSLARRYYHVVEFGVDQKYRRQGVGRELFDYMKSIARSKGYQRMELNMWEFNEGALRFYEAMGFTTYRRYMEWSEEL